MSVKLRVMLAAATIIALAAPCVIAAEANPYKEDWESLSKHEAAPEWFQDTKLGIYFHWGVYTVPAFDNEWYPRNMHIPGQAAYQHHLETYGHPSKFGYHDFVPMFKAEKFDAEAWADLFQATGARFAGPVAEHHDGFSMWDSDVTPWNVKDMGPKRDITGELTAALRKRGMKLITTFHHARNLQRYHTPIKEAEFDGGKMNRMSHYPFIEGMPPTSTDPKLRMLYGNIPEEEWLPNVWLAKLKEVINKYQPDMIWFDSWLDQIPEEYRQEFCAYYLNEAEKIGKEVVIIRKQEDLPLDFTVLDHEKSRMSGASEQVWMTDDTISKGSWCYTRDLQIKTAAEIIHALADTVSKNGIVLLNVSPMSDGSIPEDQRTTLKGIGEWMKTNGEAIYATRPWITYGEGPTKEPEGGFKDNKKFLELRYSDQDVRYTRSKNGKSVYAIRLGSPAPGSKLTLASFTPEQAVKGVSLLKTGEAIEWNQSGAGLEIGAPKTAIDSAAVVYKIQMK